MRMVMITLNTGDGEEDEQNISDGDDYVENNDGDGNFAGMFKRGISGTRWWTLIEVTENLDIISFFHFICFIF